MSAINVTSVEVLDNPTHFANPLQFEIQYECLYQLQHGEGLLLHPASFCHAWCCTPMPCLRTTL